YTRYLYPAFPALAALMSLALVRLLPSARLRYALALGGFLLVPLGNFLQLSFFDVWTRWPKSVLAQAPFGFLDTSSRHEFTHRPRREPWALESIVDILQKHTTTPSPQPIRGGLYIRSWPLSSSNIMFLATARNIPLELWVHGRPGGSIAPFLDK